MATLVSKRAAAVVSHCYDDFRVREGELDLRGDNSPPLAAVTTALARQFRALDLTGYGNVQGEERLRRVLGAMFNLPADNIVVTAGGSEALNLALLCSTEPGDRALLPTPAFPGFDQLAFLAALEPVHYQVPGPPPRAGDASVTVVCTPHNPTGICIQPTALRRDQRPVIWDVSHMPPFTRQLRQLTAAFGDTDIVVFSASKLLRIPGARIGMLASHNSDLIGAAVATKTHLSMSTSRLSQHLATVVLTDPATRAEILARTAVLDGYRDQLARAISTSSTLIADPATAGTHLLVRARTGGDGWALLRGAGIVGLPGPVFGAAPSTVRLCVAQPAATVRGAAMILAAQ